MGKYFLVLLAVLCLAGCSDSTPGASDGRVLRLGTTTSTRDSGLLDALVPLFERETGCRVDVIAAGTGKAIKLAEAGDVDVILVHARSAEDAFVASGHGIRREDVMFNEFVILGPKADPAGIGGMLPSEALRALASGGHRFVSRSDDSGTHKRELKLWGGAAPTWGQYIETGQGMGRTLIVADEMMAYVLTDRGTYLSFKDKIDLVPIVSGHESLRNPYGVIVVNPAKTRSASAELADAFVDFLVSDEIQRKIGRFTKNGEVLFHPHPGDGQN
jgi:tungstate transport system substrate-binding protein